MRVELDLCAGDILRMFPGLILNIPEEKLCKGVERSKFKYCLV